MLKLSNPISTPPIYKSVLITVYFGNLEIVPFTERKHLVLLSKETEKWMGETQFEQLKAAFKGKILPAIHPEKRENETDS